jgi:TolA-binding protein
MPTVSADTSDAALDAQVFWFRYRKELAGLLVLALLLVIGFTAWRFYQERREIASSETLAGAKTAADYEVVINRYGGTPAAAAAYLLLADAQRKSGKLADANATLQRFLDKFPRHELASTARMSIAANLEALGKEDEATAVYQQIVAVDSTSFNAPRALLEQAKILQTKGRVDEARHVCETIITKYQQSYAAAQASQLLATLKPAASPAGNIKPSSASATASPAASLAPSAAKP